MCLCVRPRAFVFCQWHTLGATLHSDPAPLDSAPLRLLHGAVVQRLSSRKITCKAFPFVVEEQRVTSYFLLVKKNTRRNTKTSKAVHFSGRLFVWICTLDFCPPPLLCPAYGGQLVVFWGCAPGGLCLPCCRS